MNVTEVFEGNFDDVNYYPLVLDYDFAGGRPRGASCRIDFYSFGKLTEYTSGFTGTKTIYVEKIDLEPSSGFFLLDFNEYADKPDEFIRILTSMNIKKVYLEKSSLCDMSAMLADTGGIEVVLVDFTKCA